MELLLEREEEAGVEVLTGEQEERKQGEESEKWELQCNEEGGEEEEEPGGQGDQESLQVLQAVEAGQGDHPHQALLPWGQGVTATMV